MVFLLNIILTVIAVNVIEIFVSIAATSETVSKSSVHISRGYFTENIPVYDFVYPVKVSDDGKETSHFVTNYYTDDFSHKKKKREIKEEKLHYNLPLSDGRTLKLVLTPNYDIATPSLVVEHKNLETEFNIGNTRVRRASRKRCYYRGKVVGDPNSDIAMSTCRGLAGYVRSSNGDYFIEPSSVYDPVDGQVHPHIIFKQSHYKKNLPANDLLCGNKINVYKTQRDEYRKEKDINEVQEDDDDDDELHENCITQLVKFDDEETNDHETNKTKSNDDRNENDSSEDETEYPENSDDNNEHSEQIVTTEKILLKEQKTNKKLKGKLQKFVDETYRDSDSYSPENVTEEQYFEKKDDLGKNNDSNDKLQNKQFLFKSKKKSFKVFDTNTESINSQSRDSNSINGYEDYEGTGGNNISYNSISSNDYNYNQDINTSSSNKKSKKIKSADLSCFDLNKSYLQTDNNKMYHNHVHSIDEAKADVCACKTGTHRKKKFENCKNKKSSSKKESKHLIAKRKLRKIKGFDLINNDDASELFDNTDKIEGDVMNNVELTNDKTLFFNNSSHVRTDYRNILQKNKDNSDLKKHSRQRKMNPEKRFLDDEKLNFNSVSQGSINFLNRIPEGSNSSLKLDSVIQYKDKNVRANNKRYAEYKSCKLPSVCQNKTECNWEIRLLMVISYLFSQRHKDIDLETFVLTIVNMVNRNFQESSMGVLINIKLVRMVFIEYKMEELDEDKNKLEDLFENFCLFQYRINPFRAEHPNHHDIAIYIISTNLCNINLIYGLSNQASVCDCQKAGIVSIDEGLLLGNIITHQIGHSLGAEHIIKGSEHFCDPAGKKVYFLMDAAITMNLTQWSKCSSNAIRKFIRTQGAKCLKHKSVDLDFDWPMYMLPGQIYSPVQQCSLNFHMPLMPCLNGDFCKNLYCQINEKQCISNLVAPADGTVCATHMWCVRGYCVTEGRYPEMVNGDWNMWGPWSPCTRSCGGGIQQAKRLCNNPPPSRGGRYCIGKRTRYRVCSTERCDQHSMAFREQQCRRTEENSFRGQFYSWSAFYNNFEYVECSLLCQSETGLIAVRRLVAEDGTSCKPGTKNLCIAGKCTEVGCDWGINSGAVVDACGQCHGNGTECKIIQGLYTESISKGYVPFMKVPRGSGMIYTRELNPSDVLLVVSSFNSGKFYLNTFNTIDRMPKSGDIDFGSARGLYSILGGTERIFIPGPTDEDLVFFAKFNKDKNPGIRYQFALPEVDPTYIPTYSWQFIDWETCSDACGGGQQKSLPKCVEDQGGIVESIYCSELKRPDIVVRSCNEFPCLPKWWVGSWSECITVGNEEVRYRSVLCMRTRDPNSLRNEILKEKYCCDEEKPDSVRRCNETYARCQEKAERCELYEYFPSVMNLNDLNVRFTDINQENQNDEYEDFGANNLQSDDIQPGLRPSTKQQIIIDRHIEQLHKDVYKPEDKTSQPLLVSRSRENINSIIKNRAFDYRPVGEIIPVKVNDAVAKLTDDAISPVNLSSQAAVKEKEFQKKMPVKKLHEDDNHQKALSKNATASNSTIGGNIKINKLGKIEGSPVAASVFNNPKNSKVNVSCTTGNFVKLANSSEILTTCKSIFTCKTDDRDICNITEHDLPYKCPPQSPPLKSVLDQVVLSEYKLAIIPTVCESHMVRPGDHDYETFHDSILWAVGLEQNKSLLFGKEALNFLLNVRRNMSRIPFVYQAEN